MNSLTGLLVRLEGASRPDRRLDSEIVAAVLGPAGCVLDSIEGLDGWDIQLAPDEDGQAAHWLSAEDIPGVTAFLESACELVIEARPRQAAVLISRALRRLPEPDATVSGADMAACGARAIVTELLQVLVAECVEPAQAA